MVSRNPHISTSRRHNIVNIVKWRSDGLAFKLKRGGVVVSPLLAFVFLAFGHLSLAGVFLVGGCVFSSLSSSESLCFLALGSSEAMADRARCDHRHGEKRGLLAGGGGSFVPGCSLAGGRDVVTELHQSGAVRIIIRSKLIIRLQ